MRQLVTDCSTKLLKAVKLSAHELTIASHQLGLRCANSQNRGQIPARMSRLLPLAPCLFKQLGNFVLRDVIKLLNSSQAGLVPIFANKTSTTCQEAIES